MSTPPRQAAAKAPLSFAVLSHAVLHERRDVFGPAHNVVEHLVAAGYPTELLLHPLAGSGESITRSYREGALVDESRRPTHGRLGELRQNARLLARGAPTVAIAVDPLNYLGLWLATRRGRAPLRVYYTADYTTRRFANPVLNTAYYRLDRLALGSAEVTWNVSAAIAAERERQGRSPADNFVVANAPPFDAALVVPWLEREPDSLVFVGMLDRLVDWTLLLDALGSLARSRPALALDLVGDGPDAGWLRGEVAARGLQHVVRFRGLRPHGEALEIVSQARIGLALYSGLASWNNYRDSLKVREYLSRGLPVLSTATHPLAAELEARGAGAVVGSPQEAARALERLLEPAAGVEAAAAALELARAADRTAVMERAVGDLRARLAARAG